MNPVSTLAKRFAAWDESEGALGRHSVLLASLVMLLVALPLSRILSAGETRFSVLFSLVLFAAVFVSSPSPWAFRLTVLVGGLAIAGSVTAAVSGSEAAYFFADGLGLGLLGLTTLLMLNSLLSSERVSADTVVGGICVYLLIGLCFSMAYGLLCDFAPGAIVEAGEIIEPHGGDRSAFAAKLLYFSFVTLTTLGYGDIQPVSELAQMMAVGEAVVGQLYLAIFVARLVALYVTESRAHEPRTK